MARKKFTSKRERFIGLAENRTNAVINNLRILSNCSNKSLYEYDPSEIEKIFGAIDGALMEAKSKFKDKKTEKFKLQ